jgi:hypothetical protein
LQQGADKLRMAAAKSKPPDISIKCQVAVNQDNLDSAVQILRSFERHLLHG